MAKVGDLLRLPAFRGIRLIAGEAGLEKKVEHVTVMEVPDIKRWLKGNDLLITSFYSVRKNEEDQCRLIRDVSDICCCVAVKTGQYIERIPESVKMTANQCGLPLMEIPFQTSYIDLLINVMSLIFEEENTASILEKYINDIIYENYTDKILMIERGRLFGLGVDENYFAAVNIGFRKKYTPADEEKKKLRFLCQALQRDMLGSSCIYGCNFIQLKKGFMILVEAEEKEALEKYLESYLNENRMKMLWQEVGKKVVCGIGPTKTGLKGIRDTYSLSFKAMKVGTRIYKHRFIYSYWGMELFCELEKLLVSDSKLVFTGILDGLKNQELIDTLITYYECCASVDQVANRMFTHKNTVKYRLNRLQELTGLELKNPSDNFRLYLAVLGLKMNDEIR